MSLDMAYFAYNIINRINCWLQKQQTKILDQRVQNKLSNRNIGMTFITKEIEAEQINCNLVSGTWLTLQMNKSFNTGSLLNKQQQKCKSWHKSE